MPAINPSGLTLVWPPWFTPTYADMQTLAQAVGAAVTAGAISRRVAVTMMQPATGIPSIDGELAEIEKDLAAADKRIVAVGGQVQDRTGQPVLMPNRQD